MSDVLEVGERVSVRGGLPRDMGIPIAEVVSVGPVNVKVRLFFDGSTHAVLPELLRSCDRREAFTFPDWYAVQERLDLGLVPLTEGGEG